MRSPSFFNRSKSAENVKFFAFRWWSFQCFVENKGRTREEPSPKDTIFSAVKKTCTQWCTLLLHPSVIFFLRCFQTCKSSANMTWRWLKNAPSLRKAKMCKMSSGKPSRFLSHCSSTLSWGWTALMGEVPCFHPLYYYYYSYNSLKIGKGKKESSAQSAGFLRSNAFWLLCAKCIAILLWVRYFSRTMPVCEHRGKTSRPERT